MKREVKILLLCSVLVLSALFVLREKVYAWDVSGIGNAIGGTIDSVAGKGTWQSIQSAMGGSSNDWASDTVYTIEGNSAIIANAVSIPLTQEISQADTTVKVGAADNYQISFGGNSIKVIQDEVGNAIALPVTFSGPTSVTYNLNMRDQGEDSPNYMWLTSDFTTLSVLNSDEAAHSLVVNDQGEAIYTMKEAGITQTMVFDPSGKLSGIEDTSDKGTLNLAFQNDLGSIFGNVAADFWSFEANDNYALSFDTRTGISKLTLSNSDNKGSDIIGQVPTIDPELGKLSTVHIKTDTIDFIYENGTKSAESFVNTGVEYWNGANGIEAVPKE